MAQQTYIVKGMDCADCALNVEKGVRQMQGVETARVDFATGLLHVQGTPSSDALHQRVKALGYQLEEKTMRSAARPMRQEQGSAVAGFWRYLLGRVETRLALAGGFLLVISFLAGWLGAPPITVRVSQIIALGIAGYPIARGAVAGMWINHEISINLLMTIAAVGAVVIGETAESATLIFLFAISEALEGFTTDRARRVLDELGDLAPLQAIRLADGREEFIPVEMLRVNDTILIRAGERIPMDGIVIEGHSAVNQAPITGESLPVEKGAGDEIFAGTVNGSGTLHVQVSRLAEDTTIQRIIHMIEQAQSLRAPTQRFIDRFARVYTPVMVLLAVLVAAIPPLAFGQPFFNPAGGTGWLHRALTLLVIACPCALVISAPVTLISAITAAARRGVLIKGGTYLEALAEIRVFAFDKTGTLTNGKPVVTAFRSVDCGDEEVTSGCACEEVLALASALESRSSHPLARSVVSAAELRGVGARYQPADEVVALTGSGVQGRVNGKLATVGSHKLFEEEHPHDRVLCQWIDHAEAQGQSTMLVSDGDRVRGFIAVADTIREDSRAAVAGLKDTGALTVMLTGDNLSAAQTIGADAGVDSVRAGLMPEDKVRAVQALSEQYGSTAMIGDGINDTPALAAATLGIAMGGAASAQAMETADIVLMGNDLHSLPFAVRLARFTRRLIRDNVVISLVTKLVFVGLALTGLTSLWLAVLADVGVSLAVTINGMRANRFEQGAD